MKNKRDVHGDIHFKNHNNIYKITTIFDTITVAVCVILCGLCIISKRPHTQKIWSNPLLSFSEGNYGITIEGAYRTITDGPGLTLPVGRYRLQWYIEGDGENTITFSSSNGAIIKPAVFTTSPDEYEGDVTFEVVEPVYNLCINVNFQSGTSIAVHSIRISSPFYSDNTVLFCLASAFITLFSVLYRHNKLNNEQAQTLVFAFFVTLFVAYPFLNQSTPAGWDVNYHAARIMNLVDSIQSGQFVSRVGGFSYNGYGAATAVFYPDLFLVPSAILIIYGCTVTFVYNLFIFSITFFMIIGMVYAARRLGADSDAARCAAIFYAYSNYHLYDLHMNSMLGELIAMMFLPLFFCALLQVLKESPKKWPFLSLTAFCIFSSHVVTTLHCIFLATGFTIYYFQEIKNDPRKITALVKALFVTVLISINRIITFFDFYTSGVQTPVVQHGMNNLALEGSMLFEIDECMGPLMWIAFFFGLYRFKLENCKDTRRLIGACIFFGVFGIFLSSKFFPWAYVEHWTQGLVNALFQFPSRFLMMTAFLFSFIGGFGIVKLFPSFRGHCFLILYIIAALSGSQIISNFKKNVSSDTNINFGESASPYLSNGEYQFWGTDVANTRDKSLIVSDGINIEFYEKVGTSCTVTFSSLASGSLSFPLFGFDGYYAELDGKSISWYRGINNRLTIDIPERTSGTIKILYRGKILWTILDIFSFVIFIIFFIRWIVSQTQRQTLRS